MSCTRLSVYSRERCDGGDVRERDGRALRPAWTDCAGRRAAYTRTPPVSVTSFPADQLFVVVVVVVVVAARFSPSGVVAAESGRDPPVVSSRRVSARKSGAGIIDPPPPPSVYSPKVTDRGGWVVFGRTYRPNCFARDFDERSCVMFSRLTTLARENQRARAIPSTSSSRKPPRSATGRYRGGMVGVSDRHRFQRCRCYDSENIYSFIKQKIKISRTL